MEQPLIGAFLTVHLRLSQRLTPSCEETTRLQESPLVDASLLPPKNYLFLASLPVGKRCYLWLRHSRDGA